MLWPMAATAVMDSRNLATICQNAAKTPPGDQHANC